MAIEQGLLQLLTSDTDVNDLVGTKVYWILAPKGAAVPYVVLSRVTTNDVYDMNGATGFRNGLFQVDCYATDYYTSRAISLAVRQILESFIGNLPDTATTAVAAVFTEKDWDMPYEEGSKGFVYRALLQFRIHHYDASFLIPTNENNGPEPSVDGGSF